MSGNPSKLIGISRKPEKASGERTACIRTFGCQMNVHDSDRIRRMVLDAGYTEVQEYEDADLVILNTCNVRENAVDRVKGHLGKLNYLRKEGRLKRVALTGCIGAAEESEELKEKFGIDLILGTQNTYEMAQFVGLPNMEETYTPNLPGVEGAHSAFVTIMTGCNYICSYCIVPSVRGRMICRSLSDIEREIEQMVSTGTGYITLLGQTVDAWREDGKRFADLLERTSEMAPRLWFTTSHPSNMEDRTLRIIGQKPSIVKRLHLPVQSGSDRMLKIMHRGYRAERYRRKIEVFREHVPEGIVSTDIIVGHPGETEDDHHRTLQLVEDCAFDSAYIFKFSPRSTTEGARLHREQPVEEKTLQRRFLEVMRAVEHNALRTNRKKVGEQAQIFIKESHDSEGRAIGESWSGQNVHVANTQASPGEYVEAAIEAAGPHALYARALS